MSVLAMLDEIHKLKHDITELNRRLAERAEAFNEADKRRVARIQELEDQLRLKEVECDNLAETQYQAGYKAGWEDHCAVG